MKHSIQAVSAEGSHVEVAGAAFEYDAKGKAKLASEFCPLATIYVYIREPFQMPGGKVGDERFRLSLVAKFRDGEEVK